jgi:hypothetical protein
MSHIVVLIEPSPLFATKNMKMRAPSKALSIAANKNIFYDNIPVRGSYSPQVHQCVGSPCFKLQRYQTIFQSQSVELSLSHHKLLNNFAGRRRQHLGLENFYGLLFEFLQF